MKTYTQGDGNIHIMIIPIEYIYIYTQVKKMIERLGVAAT